MKTESFLCPICASPDAHVLYNLTRHRVVRCQQCHLMYNPDFPKSRNNKTLLFGQNYYLDVQKEAFTPQLNDYRCDPSLPFFEEGLSRIEFLLSNKKGRILDVGSALGTFLKLASDRGWQAQGVEFSTYGADYAKKKHGLEIFNGDLLEAPFQPSTFDCITFWDVLEHVEKPLENLRRAYELLRPGGVLLITTDNYDCLLISVANLMYRLSGGYISYAIERLFILYNKSYFVDCDFHILLQNLGFGIHFFKKIDYPLVKIKTNILEKLVLRFFYFLSTITNKQAQFIIICLKPQAIQS